VGPAVGPALSETCCPERLTDVLPAAVTTIPKRRISRNTGDSAYLPEREGFEPSMDETAHSGFRDRRGCLERVHSAATGFTSSVPPYYGLKTPVPRQPNVGGDPGRTLSTSIFILGISAACESAAPILPLEGDCRTRRLPVLAEPVRSSKRQPLAHDRARPRRANDRPHLRRARFRPEGGVRIDACDGPAMAEIHRCAATVTRFCL
jgi:hypothetical protein